jgi:hypothetical protein
MDPWAPYVRLLARGRPHRPKPPPLPPDGRRTQRTPLEIQRLDFGATSRALSNLCKQGKFQTDAEALPLLARAGELLDAGAHVRAGDVASLAHNLGAHNLGKMRLRGAAVQRAWGSIAAWSEPSLHLFKPYQLGMLVRVQGCARDAHSHSAAARGNRSASGAARS